MAVLLVACGGDEEPLGPTATVPQPTTTTNPYAVPAIIDEAYVNRVLAGLDQAVGDVVRLVVNSRTIPPEAIERLQALYVGEALQLEVDNFQDDMFNNFLGYRDTPGNKTTSATQLIDVRTSCIFAQVHKNFAAVSFTPDPKFSTQWVALIPESADDPRGYNPTGWVFRYDGFQKDLSAPPNPCADS